MSIFSKQHKQSWFERKEQIDKELVKGRLCAYWYSDNLSTQDMDYILSQGYILRSADEYDATYWFEVLQR